MGQKGANDSGFPPKPVDRGSYQIGPPAASTHGQKFYKMEVVKKSWTNCASKNNERILAFLHSVVMQRVLPAGGMLEIILYHRRPHIIRWPHIPVSKKLIIRLAVTPRYFSVCHGVVAKL